MIKNHALLNGTIGLLLVIISIAAAAGSIDNASSDTRLDAMSRLHHWSGIWKGSGWSMSGPGQRSEFEITETVEPRLGGRVLLVEGRGRSQAPDGEWQVTHEALGVVSYDPVAGRYNFQTHAVRGGAHAVELVIEDDGLMRWGFTDDSSGAQLRFEIRVEGDTWHETGQVSPDGGSNWYPMLDMTLTRQTSESQ